MDAVELPLSVASKLQATDGFGRVGEPETRDSDRGDASISGSRKDSNCSSYRRDVKCPLTISRCNSVFRSNKANAELYLHESMIPNYKCEEKGDPHHLGEADKPILLSPKHEGKPLNRRAVKKLSSLASFKRPRTDQTENSTRIVGADDVGVISRKKEITGFTSPDKPRKAKKKSCQVGKRTDKKNARTNMRTKHDSFASKADFARSDPSYGGNNVLDLHDVTKHVDDLSLTELLDGGYKSPNKCPKLKKAPNFVDNILLSVTKACSVLPMHGAVYSNGNKKASLNLPNSCSGNPNSCSANLSDSDDKDKCKEESVPFSKDPCRANLGDAILYQPKAILERLAFPPAEDLDAFLNSSMASLNLLSTSSMTTIHHARLSPFPWSFPHGGSWKTSVDPGKLTSTRNTGQGRWVRIGSNSTSIGVDHNCFSELELKTLDHNEDSLNLRKIDDLLQDVKALTAPVKPSFDGPFNMSHAMASPPKAHIPDSTISMKGSGFFGSSRSKMLNILEDADSSDSRLESVSEAHVFHRNVESDVGLRCQGNESNLWYSSNFNLRFKESEVAQKELYAGRTHFPSDSCYYYSKSAAGECDQSSWQLPAPEISKLGHSPSLVAAAEILCEMASRSESIRTQNHAFRRIKWPKAPSQKTMKARKSTSLVEKKTDRLFLAASHCDPVKSTNHLKHKLVSEKKNGFNHMINSGRESVRWSDPAEGGASLGKPEMDLSIHPRPLHGSSIRPSGVVPSPTRAERESDGRQKIRRVTMKASSLVSGGTYIKDWSRGRSKRV